MEKTWANYLNIYIRYMFQSVDLHLNIRSNNLTRFNSTLVQNSNYQYFLQTKNDQLGFVTENYRRYVKPICTKVPIKVDILGTKLSFIIDETVVRLLIGSVLNVEIIPIPLADEIDLDVVAASVLDSAD